jgi:hypothetical protein
LRIGFVTPCWKREHLTRVCLQHRAWTISRLPHGVEGFQVVIAADENLNIADELGCDTVEHRNVLGERWNVGYRRAAELGADYVVPVGSDTWLHPDLFRGLTPDAVAAARTYAVVRDDGLRIAELDLGRPVRERPLARFAVSAWAFPAAILSTAAEPCKPGLMKGCDGSTFRRLEAAGPLPFRYVDSHPLDVVAFRSDVQITPYERLTQKFHGREHPDPFARLAEHHPAALVEQAEALYAGVTV